MVQIKQERSQLKASFGMALHRDHLLVPVSRPLAELDPTQLEARGLGEGDVGVLSLVVGFEEPPVRTCILKANTVVHCRHQGPDRS